MKKRLIKVFIILFVIVLGFGIAEKNNFLEMKRWGERKYYIQVKENGTKVNTKDKKGNPSYYYNYEKVAAYNKDGQKIEINYISSKNLKMNAYICVYVKFPRKNKINTIQSYEEVAYEKLPQKVKGKLNKVK
ncbi:YxeA family protein [Clostridium oceanicum]|uniref:YxeA family protein n=1 Tax=Clostridium oceanicum TaxID=1543 RepID=A0ABP3UG99_9CLOT